MLSIIGSSDHMQEVSRIYFSSTHHKLAMISEKNFSKRLPNLFVTADRSFITLCLCMLLVQGDPQLPTRTAVTSLYVTAKSYISFLESTGRYSVNTIQSMLLVTLYEVGHGIYPAASVSIAGCARGARNIGLHRTKTRRHFMNASVIDVDEIEEKRRTWWAIHNLDRCVYYSVTYISVYRLLVFSLTVYIAPSMLIPRARFINLYNGDAIFNTEDADIDDTLPVDDEFSLQVSAFCHVRRAGSIDSFANS